MTHSKSDQSIVTSLTLLERAKVMDSDAWERFFKVYQPFVLQHARAAGLNEADADDVAQQTMVCIWTGLPMFRYEPDKCRFRTWVQSILRDRIADHFRKLGRLRRRIAPLPDDGTGTSALNRIEDPGIPHPGTDADAQWDANLLRAARERIRARFSQREFQIVEYLEAHDGNSRQTATDLGISMARVYVAKNRVLGQVKRELKRLKREFF